MGNKAHKQGGGSPQVQAWHQGASLKDGFDRLANAYGYVDITDEAAITLAAGYLEMDPDVVRREMKGIDMDSNNLVSFAEFALWTDRHTVGKPLGLGSVPDKREWRKGMPTYWTSIPEAEAPEEPAPVVVRPRTRGGGSPAAAAEDESELDAFADATLRADWTAAWQILDRHPDYSNKRPPEQGWNAIHQAACQGDVPVLRRLVHEYGANPRLPSKDGMTAAEVASRHGKNEAAACLAELVLEYKPAGAEGGSTDPMQVANEIIEQAKWAKWDEMFRLIEKFPEAQNLRPEYRVFGAIHQAAFNGNAKVLQRLVEGRADAGLKTRDRRTALQVARSRFQTEAVTYLESLSGLAGATGEQLQRAHDIIDQAKDGNWGSMFELLGQGPPGLVNMRPEVRPFAVLHQAAYHGDMEVMRRLIEEFKADPRQLTKDKRNALQVARDEKQEQAATYLEACIPTIILEDAFVTYPEQQFVTLGKTELAKFQDLLTKTHKKTANWTRDRDMATGEYIQHTPVPQGYELVGVKRNENPALWRVYQVSREIMEMECRKPPAGHGKFERWEPFTAQATRGVPDFATRPDANEWLLLHAGIPEALSAIARHGFSMAKLGCGANSDGGGLYGDGTYFAESITKADEYARRQVDDGEFRGCRAVALVRVLGGRHFYTDQDVQQADKPKFAQRVLQGHFNTTVGDRLKLKNTFREYVVYDAAGTYLEYVMYYRRRYREGVES